MSANQGEGAIVTGAASGIGRAIAAGLAADGFSVVIADLDEVKGDAATKEIAASNKGRAIFQRVDVTDRTSVSAAIGCMYTRIRLDQNHGQQRRLQQAGTFPRGE
jgi:NAD(P)-dependent dehydrogenase (short-subunit alcohol dehydrogenase family)